MKTITSKDFLSVFGTGQYNIPEGATIFKSHNSESFWCIGGAKHTKPGHWNCSNQLIQVKLKPLSDANFTLDGFKLFNHSVSATSQFPNFAFSPGIAVDCSSFHLLGFTVNGKNLNCPGRDLLLSNEIRIIETVSDTTFRNRIIRDPARADRINPGFTDEVLQSGDVPPPMYCSTLTSLEINKIQFDAKTGGTSGPSGRAILACGAVLKNQHLSNIDLMFYHVETNKEVSWQEESCGGIWILDWCMDPLSFNWRKVLDIEARTFHSAVLLGTTLLLFGGTNVQTGERLPLSPVAINTVIWEVIQLDSQISVGSLHPIDLNNLHISAQSMVKTSDNGCIGVGGYRQKDSSLDEEASGDIFHFKFKMNQGLVENIESYQSKSLNSGCVSHNQLLNTPSKSCLIVAGGTLERWAILSTSTVAGSPCDLDLKGMCKVTSNEDSGTEYVNWIGCDGPCKRWFHTICLFMDKKEFEAAAKNKKWFCRRADCRL